jgi:hypothetical protein
MTALFNFFMLSVSTKFFKGNQMKRLLALALLISMYSVSSYAIVHVVHDCKTSDNQYRVLILDNQGIVPNHTDNLYATIADKNGSIVNSFAVQSNEGTIMSSSFGRIMYTDTKTQGQRFSLAFPSTNYRHTSLLVMMEGRSVLNDENLICE